MKKPRFRTLLILALAASLAGLASLGACASRDSAPEAPAYQKLAELGYAAGGAANAPSAAAPPMASAPMSPGAADAAGEGMSRGNLAAERKEEEAPTDSLETKDPKSDEGGQPTTQATPVPVKRKVHYDGYAKVMVTRPVEVVDELVALTTSSGGFVERLVGTTVTLRVPVDKFDEIYKKILSMGDVLEKSVSAQDITDAMTEIGLRLETAKATRERLLILLQKAQSESEKLRLLAEIQRVTEQIDRMTSQLKTLENLANFSRITVELVQRQAMTGRSTEDVAEFRWIHQLSPFQRIVAFEGKKLELKVPDGLVALDDGKHFIAESADGAVFWAGKLKNQPEGSTDFWLEALKVRLEPEFFNVTVETFGQFKVLRMEDRSETPYIYRVGVRVNDKDLELVEVYYPSAAHETRYAAAVKSSIEGGAQ